MKAQDLRLRVWNIGLLVLGFRVQELSVEANCIARPRQLNPVNPVLEIQVSNQMRHETETVVTQGLVLGHNPALLNQPKILYSIVLYP